jgi:hypothetical protein
MKIVVALLLFVGSFAAPAWAQHFTARFFTSTGRPQDVRQVLFSPASTHLAVQADDGIHFLHVESGRETKSYRLAPLATAFTPKGYQLLAVAEQGTVLLPVVEGIAVDAPWQLPLGYLGVTFTQESGKILVERMAPGGPAALSGDIHVGDEIVAVVAVGKETSVLGESIPRVIERLAGLAGTSTTLRIVPRGELNPKNVTLRRAGGVKQNNQVTFQPFVARSSPQAVAVRWQDSLVVLDAQQAAPISVIQPVDIEPFGLQSFAPDGRLLAVTSHRRQKVRGEPELMLEVYDVARQARVAAVAVDTTNVYAQRFLPDGQRIAFGLKDRILVYDLRKQSFVDPILIGFDPSRYQAKSKSENDEAFSPLNLNARLDYLVEDEAPARVEYPEQLLASFDVSPDGKLVAVGSCHGELRVFSATEHKEHTKIGERTVDEAKVKPVAFSPDGQWLAYYLSGTLHWEATARFFSVDR